MASRHAAQQLRALLSTAVASTRHPQACGAHMGSLGDLLARQVHSAPAGGRHTPTSLLGIEHPGTAETGHRLEQRATFRSSASALAQTYYEILGVTRSAKDSEVKKAYYKLAKKFHPDTNQDNPDAAKKFQEISKAYDTLRDPQKRSAYDQLGHANYEAAEAGGGGPGAGGPFGGQGGAQVDPEDLFREFFGGGGGGRGGGGFQGTIFEHIFSGGGGGGFRPRRGHSVQAALTISFEEAVKGTTRVIDPSSLGIRGAGSRPQQVEIKIPAGVDNGFQLRVEGHGMPGPQGTPPGDLLVQVMVLPSPRFERDGFDLYSEARLNLADAALGTSVEVPTIDGRAEVKVKPGTQPGDKLRMRGYGVPMDLAGQRGRRGDQYVVVKVVVPKTLTERQKQLLEEFRGGKAAGSSNPGTGRAGGAPKNGSSRGSSSSSTSGGAASNTSKDAAAEAPAADSTASQQQEAGAATKTGAEEAAGGESGEEKGGKKKSWWGF